jgi:hypothetical protein
MKTMQTEDEERGSRPMTPVACVVPPFGTAESGVQEHPWSSFCSTESDLCPTLALRSSVCSCRTRLFSEWSCNAAHLVTWEPVACCSGAGGAGRLGALLAVVLLKTLCGTMLCVRKLYDIESNGVRVSPTSRLI